MSKVAINCLTTGIPGLDSVLAGGLPEFSFNVIAGPPRLWMSAREVPPGVGRAAVEDAALSTAIRFFR